MNERQQEDTDREEEGKRPTTHAKQSFVIALRIPARGMRHRIAPLHLAVAAVTVTGVVGCCYYYHRVVGWRLRRRRRRHDENDDDDDEEEDPSTPVDNETERLYAAHRRRLRRVASRAKDTDDDDRDGGDRYRDAGLRRHIRDCQTVKRTLRSVPDPERARREKLRDTKLRQIKAASGQGPLGLSPDQLTSIRSSLRDVSNK